MRRRHHVRRFLRHCLLECVFERLRESAFGPFVQQKTHILSSSNSDIAFVLLVENALLSPQQMKPLHALHGHNDRNRHRMTKKGLGRTLPLPNNTITTTTCNKSISSTAPRRRRFTGAESLSSLRPSAASSRQPGQQGAQREARQALMEVSSRLERDPGCPSCGGAASATAAAAAASAHHHSATTALPPSAAYRETLPCSGSV